MPTMQFTMEPTEYAAAKAFVDEHYEKHKASIRKAAAGGGFSYVFGPCGIGTSVSVRCDVCKAEKDVTDYESW